jgi:WD40 repeat protein
MGALSPILLLAIKPSVYLDSSVCIWRKGGAEWKYDAELKGHTGRVTDVVVPPNGQKILAESTSDKTLRCWSVESGVCLMELETSDPMAQSVLRIWFWKRTPAALPFVDGAIGEHTFYSETYACAVGPHVCISCMYCTSLTESRNKPFIYICVHVSTPIHRGPSQG